MAVDQRFHHLAGDGFDRNEKPHRPEHHGPARKHGCGHRGRQGGGDHWPHIRDETQQCAGDAPEHRRGHADHGEADRDDHSERGVDGELRQEIAPQPSRRVVEGDRGPMKVGGAEQADHAVAQIFPLHQHEDRDDDDDQQIRYRADHRGQDGAGQFERLRRRWTHLDRNRLRPGPERGRPGRGAGTGLGLTRGPLHGFWRRHLPIHTVHEAGQPAHGGAAGPFPPSSRWSRHIAGCPWPGPRPGRR